MIKSFSGARRASPIEVAVRMAGPQDQGTEAVYPPVGGDKLLGAACRK
jgi:hypothetical protein